MKISKPVHHFPYPKIKQRKVTVWSLKGRGAGKLMAHDIHSIDDKCYLMWKEKDLTIIPFFIHESIQFEIC